MHTALALWLIAANPSTAAASPDAPPVVEALVDDDVKGLRATFLVAAPPQAVLELLWDVQRFQAIFPDIESLQVLRRERAPAGEIADVRFSVDAVFKKASYTLRRRLDRRSRSIAWHSIAGDVKSVRGSWRVTPAGDGNLSQVTYTSFVDVGYIVPTGLVRDVALRKVDEMVERVRRAATSS